jgi:hypothetical protein
MNFIVKQLKESMNSKQKEECTRLLKPLCKGRADLWIRVTFVPPQVSTQICEMCEKQFPVTDLITLDCEHRFCKPDLQRRLTSKMESAYVSLKDLVCNRCFQPIPYEIIRDLVPKQLFQKYDDLLLKEVLNNQPPPPPMIKPKFKCEMCPFTFEDFEVRTLTNCDHRYCLGCLRKQFFETIDEEKELTLDSFFCKAKECGLPIDIALINDVLPPKDRDKFNELLNKRHFAKKEQLQLPAILVEDQIKEFEEYIKKLKNKLEDFKIEGDLKERVQVTITFFDDKVIKKLKKKLKFYDKVNEKTIKNEAPPEWGVFPESVRIVVLAAEDPKYQFVMTEFRKTCQNQIFSISEIQNKSLYKKYKLITSELIAAKKVINPQIDTTNFEKYLWHGTRQNNPELIYKDEAYGYDMRHAAVGSWGRGNYFGQTAQVSMGYLGYRNAQGNSILLFNKVFIGETVAGQGGLLKPPPIPGTNRFYDSTSNATMVVIYDVWRAYPHYIVEFR